MKNIIISIVAVIMAVIVIPLTIVLIMENTIDNSSYEGETEYNQE